MANREDIAPSSSEQYKKPTYQFFLEDAELEVSKELEIAQKEQNAFKFLNKISGNEKKLRQFLRLANKGVNATASIGWLEKEVYSFLKHDLQSFTDLYTDPHFEDKAFILDAVRVHAITRIGPDSYRLEDGTQLGTIYQAIEYMNKPDSSAMYNLIRERIERVG